MTFEESVSLIQKSAWQGSVLGLERLQALLNTMGNPENSIKMVHIAGTNGKGSTARMLEQILIDAGYRVGAFTSPFLTRMTEQIHFAGEEITKEQFADAFEVVNNACQKIDKLPTEFELVTATAFVYFVQMECDIVILETGMGGATDATNVIKDTLLSVITSIGIDHTAFLGNTLEEIANVKAGIIKNNSVLVTCEQQAEAMRVLEKHCNEKHAELYVAKQSDVLVENKGSLDNPYQRIIYKKCHEDSMLELALLGEHQIKNVSLVLKVIDVLCEKGYSILKEAVKSGLKNVTWPARFEILSNDPWVVLDGGHNVQGFEAVVKSFETYFKGKNIVLVTGVMRDKDYYSMYDLINPYVSAYFTVRPNNERALESKELAQILSVYGKSVHCEEVPSNGMKQALEYVKDKENTVIAVVGSLYMAGEIREFFGRK